MNIVDATFSDQQREIAAEFINGAEDRGKYIYGRNKEAASLAAFVPVDGFIDDFAEDSSFEGKPILKLREVPRGSLVVSAVSAISPLTALRNLSNADLDHIDYFSLKEISRLPLKEIPFWQGAKEHFTQNRADYGYLYESFHDDESRDTFDKIMSFRLKNNLAQMTGFRTRLKDMYFESFLKIPRESAIFFDVGAFDGYNSEHFARLYPEMSHAVLFEPIPDQARLLRRKFRGDCRFSVHELACSDQKGHVKFSIDSTASHISRDGNGVDVRTAPIDSVVEELGLYPHFLKMDIEGAEISALKGAAKMIKEKKPNLAISVYHAASHMTEAHRLLTDLHANYRFFLRHYTEGYTETVLFAVP